MEVLFWYCRMPFPLLLERDWEIPEIELRNCVCCVPPLLSSISALEFSFCYYFLIIIHFWQRFLYTTSELSFDPRSLLTILAAETKPINAEIIPAFDPLCRLTLFLRDICQFRKNCGCSLIEQFLLFTYNIF